MTDKPHIDIKPNEGEEVCDFCTSPYVYAAYPCDDFVSNVVCGFEINSRGAWAACEICSGFIEREEWTNLLDRSVRHFVRNNGVPADLIRPEIARNHMLFRQHRRMIA